ncbi:MAG: hypothetical protein M3514_03820 [Actinomycetota bacterium]|jgi:hypothetical protein|nr:hypothetical protein [Rubrobacteraceae bacterium]MDQ3496638.1 hypothetical protein [Actinomycetota bacterium]
MAERASDKGFSKRPEILDLLGAGGMNEGEAREFSYEVVRNLRGLSYHHPEGQAPDPDEVRKHREAHQHSDG